MPGGQRGNMKWRRTQTARQPAGIRSGPVAQRAEEQTAPPGPGDRHAPSVPPQCPRGGNWSKARTMMATPPAAHLEHPLVRPSLSRDGIHQGSRPGSSWRRPGKEVGSGRKVTGPQQGRAPLSSVSLGFENRAPGPARPAPRSQEECRPQDHSGRTRQASPALDLRLLAAHLFSSEPAHVMLT